MPLQGTVREGDWVRLVVPVIVLVASVAACSAMGPADAGTPTACRPGNADQWIGRAASAAVASLRVARLRDFSTRSARREARLARAASRRASRRKRSAASSQPRPLRAPAVSRASRPLRQPRNTAGSM